MAKQYIKTGRGGEGKSYYKDPEMTILHREDGPAYEVPFNYKEWWLNGKIHRLDGPAVEHAIGNNRWYVDGIFIFDVDTKGNIQARMY